MESLQEHTTHFIVINQKETFHTTNVVFLSLIDMITNEAFLRHPIIEEDQVVDFPRDHLNRVLPEISLPNEVTAALEGGASVNSNSRENQCLQLLGQGSNALDRPMIEDHGLPTLVYLGHL